LIASMALPDEKYRGGEAQSSFYQRLKTRLEALPGVESVAMAGSLPTWNTRHLPYELAGAPPVDELRRPKVPALNVGPGYFRTMGAAVLSGREFNESDGISGVPVALVNQSLASRFWPGQDARGKRLRLFEGKTAGEWLTVVGVVSNIIQDDLTRQKFEPIVYVPYGKSPGARFFLLRTRVAPESLENAFRREVRAQDADLPVYGPFPLTERLERYWDSRFYGVLFLIFAAIALLLASIGLYTVIAHAVSQRAQEIGIRMAIGATARDILRLVFAQGMLPLGIGLAIGLAASLGINRLLQSMLVSISPWDPITLIAASAVLIVAAMLGCVIPARRAMRVDPAVALRYE
jgi:predicted permease